MKNTYVIITAMDESEPPIKESSQTVEGNDRIMEAIATFLMQRTPFRVEFAEESM